jgi:cytochrome P450
MPHDLDHPLIISEWHLAREAYRSRFLRQGLYDGGIVMDNVLVNLHSTDHRDRRRLENPLFRRDVLFEYERTSFPAVLASRLQPYLESGGLDLLTFGHGVMLELSAVNAGIDLDIGDADATERLSRQLLLFIDGARILHYTGDKAAKEREVADALGEFDQQFVAPAAKRRRALLAARDAGEINEADVPRDVLRVLLENTEGLDLDPSTVLRETAFFLLTGASTSAAAMSSTLHNIFGWIEIHPEDEVRLVNDATFVQRCILETLRLAPISPIAARWADKDFTLSDGTQIRSNDRVHIDMRSANRDRSIFGADADEFRPDRDVPEGVQRAGVSFGHGQHHCIGQELAVGIEPDHTDGFEHRLFGLVGVVVQELIKFGARPDPGDPAVRDESSERGNFSRYPVLLTNSTTVP